MNEDRLSEAGAALKSVADNISRSIQEDRPGREVLLNITGALALFGERVTEAVGGESGFVHEQERPDGPLPELETQLAAEGQRELDDTERLEPSLIARVILFLNRLCGEMRVVAEATAPIYEPAWPFTDISVEADRLRAELAREKEGYLWTQAGNHELSCRLKELDELRKALERTDGALLSERGESANLREEIHRLALREMELERENATLRASLERQMARSEVSGKEFARLGDALATAPDRTKRLWARIDWLAEKLATIRFGVSREPYVSVLIDGNLYSGRGLGEAARNAGCPILAEEED